MWSVHNNLSCLTLCRTLFFTFCFTHYYFQSDFGAVAYGHTLRREDVKMFKNKY